MSKRLREHHARPHERFRSSSTDRHLSSATQQVAIPNRLVMVREAIRKRKASAPTPIITETRPTNDQLAVMQARLRVRSRPFPMGGKPPTKRPQALVLHPPLTYNGFLQR